MDVKTVMSSAGLDGGHRIEYKFQTRLNFYRDNECIFRARAIRDYYLDVTNKYYE